MGSRNVAKEDSVVEVVRGAILGLREKPDSRTQ